MTDCGKHAPDNMLAALMQRDLYQHPLTCLLDHAEPVRAHGAVLELHPRGQPASKIPPDRTAYFGEVGPHHPVPRMSQPVGELTIIGQQDQALGLIVEPADVEQALAVVGHQVSDRPPAPVIRHRAEHAGWLVQCEVDKVRTGRDSLTVHPDHLGPRVDSGAEPADDLTVDLDPPRTDEVLA